MYLCPGEKSPSLDVCLSSMIQSVFMELHMCRSDETETRQNDTQKIQIYESALFCLLIVTQAQCCYTKQHFCCSQITNQTYSKMEMKYIRIVIKT